MLASDDVKTRGALGNRAMVDADLAAVVARAVRTIDRHLILVVMPGPALEKAGLEKSLLVAREIDAGRTYDHEGNLTAGRVDGALIHPAARAAERVLRRVDDQAVAMVSGKLLPVRIDTVCVKGDNPQAVARARAVRAGLVGAGATLQPFPAFVRRHRSRIDPRSLWFRAPARPQTS